MKKAPDKIKEIKEFHFPGAIVRVHIPDLTEDEHEKRMENFKRETERFLKEAIKCKEAVKGRGTKEPA